LATKSAGGEAVVSSRAQATEETRARVLRAARAAFATQGYTGASVRRIATDAGLSAMALYTYAPSKAALFQLVYEDGIARIYAEFAEVVAGRATLVEELEAVLDRGGELLERDPDLLRFTTRVVIDHGHEDLADQQLFTQPYLEFFHDLAGRAVRRGEVDPHERLRIVSLVTMLLWGLTSVAALEPSLIREAVETAKWTVRGRFGPGSD
jgi:AcrR family transcriptional regulator